MNGVSLRSSSRAEWIKFRTVPSTFYSVLTMFALSLGLGTLIDYVVAFHPRHPSNTVFDPLSTSLAGIFFAQFVVGVIGAMFITNEFAYGTIRTSFAAVPHRILLVVSKILVMLASLVVVCEAISFLSFLIGQAIYFGHRPSLSLGQSGVVRAVAFAGLYLVLLGALGFALGMILKKTPPAIISFVVLLLILPILVHFLPSNWAGAISRYMPSQLGGGMMSLNQAQGSYPPLGCLALLVSYVVILLCVGAYLIDTRDS